MTFALISSVFNDENGPLILGGFIGLLVIAVIIINLLERQRTSNLKKVAAKNGLGFFPEADQKLLEKMNVFFIFGRELSPGTKNVIQSREGDIVTVFDYAFSYTSSEGSRTQNYSITCVESEALDLPSFIIKPKKERVRIPKMFSKLAEGLTELHPSLGYQDIQFEEHPGFSRSFVIKGENETTTREFLSRERLDFFTSRKKIHLETAKNYFILIRKKRKKAKEIVNEFKEARVLCRLLEG